VRSRWPSDFGSDLLVLATVSEKKQAKDIENLEKELDQYRNKYKAKVGLLPSL
jgi:hypothetical protein